VAYTKDTGDYMFKVQRESQATAEVSALGYKTVVVTCDAPTNHPICDVAPTPVSADPLPRLGAVAACSLGRRKSRV
jgi:hypothetical protein